MVARIGDRRLLWIDVEGRAREDLEAIAAAVGIEEPLLRRLANAPERADLTQYPEYITWSSRTIPPRSRARSMSGRPPLGGHRPRWAAPGARSDGRGDRRRNDARGPQRRGFVVAVVDEVLASYFELVEDIEQEIDRLDERAFRGRPNGDVLVRIVRLRRRIGMIRRTLAPHRVAFAALGRPEMELHEAFGQPWPGLTDRLERALDAVQNLRELLLGTFDIHMGRTAQDANEVMKVLTLLSAVLLPAVVLAGVMGMNFPLAFFEAPDHFWLVVEAMAGFATTILLAARWRGWL
jgi:Mg2+ and Co2+ transporters